MICRDLYGKRLKVGDKVIGVLSVTLGLTGIISKINKFNGISYITLLSENGETIAENIESKCFTTPERLEIHESLNCKYSLCCLDDNFYPLFEIPLTNQTQIDYEIDDVCMVYIDVTEKKEDSITTSHLYSLRCEEDTLIIHYNDCDYIKNSKTEGLCWPGEEDIVFKNKEELYRMTEEIVEYFNKLDDYAKIKKS